MAKKSVLSGLSDVQKRNMTNWVRRVNYDKDRRLKAQLEKRGRPVSESELAHIKDDLSLEKIRIGDYDDLRKLYKVLHKYETQSAPDYQIKKSINYIKERFIDYEDEYGEEDTEYADYGKRILKKYKKLLKVADSSILEDIMDSKYPELDFKEIYRARETIKNDFIQGQFFNQTEKRLDDLINKVETGELKPKQNRKSGKVARSIKAKVGSLKRTINNIFGKGKKKK